MSSSISSRTVPVVLMAIWTYLPLVRGQTTSGATGPSLSIGSIPTVSSCGSVLITWTLTDATTALALRKTVGRQLISESLYTVNLRVSNIGIDQTIPQGTTAASTSTSSTISAFASSTTDTISITSTSSGPATQPISTTFTAGESSPFMTAEEPSPFFPSESSSASLPTIDPTLSSILAGLSLIPPDIWTESIAPQIVTPLTDYTSKAEDTSTSTPYVTTSRSVHRSHRTSTSSYHPPSVTTWDTSPTTDSMKSVSSLSSTYAEAHSHHPHRLHEKVEHHGSSTEQRHHTKSERPHLPHHSATASANHPNKRVTAINQTLTTSQPANQSFTFNPIDLPAGRYQFIATINTTNAATAQSNIFTVVQGADTSCLASSNSASTATPSASPGVNTSTSSGSPSTNRNLSGGAIAGIVIGALAFLALLALIAVCCFRRRKEKKEMHAARAKGVEHIARPQQMASTGGPISRNLRSAAIGLGINTAAARPQSAVSETGTFGYSPTGFVGDPATGWGQRVEGGGDIARPSSRIFPLTRFNSTDVEVSSIGHTHEGHLDVQQSDDNRSSVASYGTTAVAIAAYEARSPRDQRHDDSGSSENRSEEDGQRPPGSFTPRGHHEDDPFTDPSEHRNPIEPRSQSSSPESGNDPFRKGPIADLGQSRMTIPASPSSPPSSAQPLSHLTYPSRLAEPHTSIVNPNSSDDSENSLSPARERSMHNRRKAVPAFIDVQIGDRKGSSSDLLDSTSPPRLDSFGRFPDPPVDLPQINSRSSSQE